MLGSNASPIAPFSTKRFSENTLDIIDNLPEIDLVLLTYDHYDHLDMDSILMLRGKLKHYFTALGVARHLSNWGVGADTITEFDWWDAKEFNDLKITFTPTRHFSGRGLTDRSQSLWGGWVIKTDQQAIYFSGDSGYGEQFKEVGKRLGPFALGFMECGQYNENWHQIHMFPEESVKAALDAGVQKALPVHWGAFALAQHHWKDPIHRFSREASIHNLSILTPPIGLMFKASDNTFSRWWDQFE